MLIPDQPNWLMANDVTTPHESPKLYEEKIRNFDELYVALSTKIQNLVYWQLPEKL